MLVGVGSGTVVSIRLGQKKGEEAEKILGNTITIFAILGTTTTEPINVGIKYFMQSLKIESLFNSSCFLSISIPLIFIYNLLFNSISQIICYL